MTGLQDVLTKGGLVFCLIIACSFIAVTVAVQRWWFLRWAEKADTAFAARIRQTGGATAPPYGDSPLSRLWAGLRGGNTGAAAESALLDESLRLERYLYVLATIATIAPLLGLLGTVFGMIKTFHAAAASGVGNPQMLAEGIAEALYNTAAGLTVTVFCIISHNFLRNWADRLTQSLEARLGELQALATARGDNCAD
ncbi:MotA/TolQ/ExbB proton channel family protein [Anaeroselena agilis]|uniref:MotA/TolQ/ExbB proton channel family protein n=1 Tax=Anaeroselena agilis TaxID=3063788 RepID=A0ABU3NU78_9FIRM|nr:MotA/TolQ/ExbB proton channel family protein [Selenomonadales bacterium 4137-cl]